jgi:uncharacterized protein (DUF433 family)
MTENTVIHNPHSNGTYSIHNATYYICATMPPKAEIQLSTRHIFRWTREGLAGGYLTGIKNGHLFINFRSLISLRIVATWRAKGIQHREITIAEKELRRHFGWEYPFAMADFWTAKPDIYMKINDILVSASRHLQYAMSFVEEYLVPTSGLTFDIFGLSATWKPQSRVLFDPQIQYGEPCIEGTRVPTQAIWAFHEAGDSVEKLAFLYGLQRGQIEDAIEWERRIQRIIAKD